MWLKMRTAHLFTIGARVMFTGPYGVSEDGAYSEYLAVKKENLSLIPANMTTFRRRDTGGLPDHSYGAEPRWISGR